MGKWPVAGAAVAGGLALAGWALLVANSESPAPRATSGPSGGPPGAAAPRERVPRDAPAGSTRPGRDAVISALDAVMAAGSTAGEIRVTVDGPEVPHKTFEDLIARAEAKRDEAMSPHRGRLSVALQRLSIPEVTEWAREFGTLATPAQAELVRALGRCSSDRVAAFFESLRSIRTVEGFLAQEMSRTIGRAPTISERVVRDLLVAVGWCDGADYAVVGNVLVALQGMEDTQGAVRLFGELYSRGSIPVGDLWMAQVIGARSTPDRIRTLVDASGCDPATREWLLEELQEGYARRVELLRLHESRLERLRSEVVSIEDATAATEPEIAPPGK